LLSKSSKTERKWWRQSCVSGNGMTFDLLLGRGLAFCVHPMAAWRVLSAPGRTFVVVAYAGAAYVAVLGVLLLS
jgi:hypothetical protein